MIPYMLLLLLPFDETGLAGEGEVISIGSGTPGAMRLLVSGPSGMKLRGSGPGALSLLPSGPSGMKLRTP